MTELRTARLVLRRWRAADYARSIAVMERLGITRAGEFEHPRLPAGHALRRHVLYRQPASRWNRLGELAEP